MLLGSPRKISRIANRPSGILKKPLASKIMIRNNSLAAFIPMLGHTSSIDKNLRKGNSRRRREGEVGRKEGEAGRKGREAGRKKGEEEEAGIKKRE